MIPLDAHRRMPTYDSEYSSRIPRGHGWPNNVQIRQLLDHLGTDFIPVVYIFFILCECDTTSVRQLMIT